MNKKEIYIVTKSCYSDYSIYGVFEVKEIAEEYARQISDNNNGEVEIHEIMNSSNLKLPIGFKLFLILMDIEGNVKRSAQEEGASEVEKCSHAQYDYPNMSKDTYNLTGNYVFYITTDKEKDGAIKIANERRIQMILKNEWPEKGKILEK